MKIELELDEHDIGYLHAAIGDLHHKMNAAISQGSFVPHMDERMIRILALWKQVEKQTGPVS